MSQLVMDKFNWKTPSTRDGNEEGIFRDLTPKQQSIARVGLGLGFILKLELDFVRVWR